jgi:hypothetical protein
MGVCESVVVWEKGRATGLETALYRWWEEHREDKVRGDVWLERLSERLVQNTAAERNMQS